MLLHREECYLCDEVRKAYFRTGYELRDQKQLRFLHIDAALNDLPVDLEYGNRLPSILMYPAKIKDLTDPDKEFEPVVLEAPVEAIDVERIKAFVERHRYVCLPAMGRI